MKLERIKLLVLPMSISFDGYMAKKTAQHLLVWSIQTLRLRSYSPSLKSGRHKDFYKLLKSGLRKWSWGVLGWIWIGFSEKFF